MPLLIKRLVSTSKYTRKNHNLFHRNGQNQLSQNVISLLIGYATFRRKITKSYTWNCKRCRLCRWMGKQKSEDSRWFNTRRTTILQDERTLETRILNITCSFSTEKELQEIFEHKKKKRKFNMHWIKVKLLSYSYVKRK